MFKLAMNKDSIMTVLRKLSKKNKQFLSLWLCALIHLLLAKIKVLKTHTFPLGSLTEHKQVFTERSMTGELLLERQKGQNYETPST